MNVWVRKTRKKSNCFYCNKPIDNGQYQIVCQYYMKSGSGRMWKKQMLFHAVPDCWLERAMATLDTRPITETRGRKANVITDDNRIKREKILRRRASVMQRIQNEMGGLMRPSKLIHMTEMLEELKTEIEPYGGVPKTWN